ENIQAAVVAIANTKLYVNRKEGFIGTSLKKDDFAFDCSDMDNVIVFKKDGTMVVTKVAEKTFVGKDIIHLDIFQKNDDRTTYNMIYVDGKTGVSYGKRFNVTGITRDKEYDLTKGNPNSKVHYFSANADGEAEVITITLSPGSKARIKVLDFYFETLEIKSRGAQGNQVTKYPIRSIKLKEKGRSTLSGQKMWYDEVIGRLNRDGKGILLGSFLAEDKIIVFYKDGTYELTDFELTNRYEPDEVVRIELFNPQKVVSAVYFDKKTGNYYGKRFKIEAVSIKNRYLFVKEGEGNYLEFVTTKQDPILVFKTGKKKTDLTEEVIPFSENIEITG